MEPRLWGGNCPRARPAGLAIPGAAAHPGGAYGLAATWMKSFIACNRTAQGATCQWPSSAGPGNPNSRFGKAPCSASARSLVGNLSPPASWSLVKWSNSAPTSPPPNPPQATPPPLPLHPSPLNPSPPPPIHPSTPYSPSPPLPQNHPHHPRRWPIQPVCRSAHRPGGRGDRNARLRNSSPADWGPAGWGHSPVALVPLAAADLGQRRQFFLWSGCCTRAKTAVAWPICRLRWWARKRAAGAEAVGGLQPDFIPPDFVADSMVDHFPAPVEGQRIIVSQGGKAADETCWSRSYPRPGQRC